MARQFKDREAALWIASYHGSKPVGSDRVGALPIDVDKMEIDTIKMERHGSSRTVLATLPRGRLNDATEAELREALEQGTVVRE